MISNNRLSSRGGFNVSVQTNKLISKGVGPGSKGVVEKYISQVTPLVNALQDAPWVSLTVLDGTPLSSPDAANLLSQGVGYCIEHNMVACAIVTLNTEHLALTQSYWQSVHQPYPDLSYAFFTDVDAANAWLDNKMRDL